MITADHFPAASSAGLVIATISSAEIPKNVGKKKDSGGAKPG
jgi:hypothetical protein